MSFSAQIKTEIVENRSMRTRLIKPFAHGLFAMCGERTVYAAKLAEIYHLDETLTDVNFEDYSPEEAAEFIAGAFLACGNVTDPEKSYHAEFVLRDGAHGDIFKALLDKLLPGASFRKAGTAIYYKEHEQIEDLLTLMGAPKACLAMIDVEILKSVRNSANRATNCETANLDKLVNAAAERLSDIALVLKETGEENLPESLLEAARLRLENPEASIRELAAMAKISRSGLHHRLSRLSRMAEELRRKAADNR
jgi:DNA-binding protein WhiA